MTFMQGLVGAVLVGGSSRRMGSDKALLDVGGVLLGQRSIDALRGAGIDQVLLVGATAEHAARLDGIVVPDEWPQRGPVGGLLSALTAAQSLGGDAVVCLACDLPSVRPSDVDGLVRAAATSGGDANQEPTVVVREGQFAFPNGVWPVGGLSRWKPQFLAGADSFRMLLGESETPRCVAGGAGFDDADRPDDLSPFL